MTGVLGGRAMMSPLHQLEWSVQVSSRVPRDSQSGATSRRQSPWHIPNPIGAGRLKVPDELERGEGVLFKRLYASVGKVPPKFNLVNSTPVPSFGFLPQLRICRSVVV